MSACEPICDVWREPDVTNHAPAETRMPCGCHRRRRSVWASFREAVLAAGVAEDRCYRWHFTVGIKRWK